MGGARDEKGASNGRKTMSPAEQRYCYIYIYIDRALFNVCTNRKGAKECLDDVDYACLTHNARSSQESVKRDSVERRIVHTIHSPIVLRITRVQIKQLVTSRAVERLLA